MRLNSINEKEGFHLVCFCQIYLTLFLFYSGLLLYPLYIDVDKWITLGDTHCVTLWLSPWLFILIFLVEKLQLWAIWRLEIGWITGQRVKVKQNLLWTFVDVQSTLTCLNCFAGLFFIIFAQNTCRASLSTCKQESICKPYTILFKEFRSYVIRILFW